jgi:hypothetical protein
MSLRMLTNLRLADLRLTTAQQRTIGQNLLSDLYLQEYNSLCCDRCLQTFFRNVGKLI